MCSSVPNYNVGMSTVPMLKTATSGYLMGPQNVNNTNFDTVKIRSRKEINIEKLLKLFPGGELQRVYDEMNKDLGIDRAPHLKFVGENEGAMAGGYSFSKNEINMSLADLMESDTKIVGIKNGKRTVLVSPKSKLPLFLNKKTAQATAFAFSKQGNLGYDRIVVEPLTENEHKKFIIQKIVHEVIHAQQHMIMRQTEGIGEKEIIKAWTHDKPKNMIDKAVLGYKTDYIFNKSYWADKPATEKIISANSDLGQQAKEWLEAVRNYPEIESPEYDKNAIEIDAHERSAEYADKKCGAWEGQG